MVRSIVYIVHPQRFNYVAVINEDTHLGFTSLAQVIGLFENQISVQDDRADLMKELLDGAKVELNPGLIVEFYSIEDYIETFGD